MTPRTVCLNAEVVEERDGTVLVKLKTGFGDPVLMVDAGRLIPHDPKPVPPTKRIWP